MAVKFRVHMRQGVPNIHLPLEVGTVEPSEAYLQTHYGPCPFHRSYVQVEVFMRHVVVTHYKTNEAAVTPEVDASVSKLVEWLRRSRGDVLAFGTQVRGFLGRKNSQHAFLRRGSKAVGFMS
jgi:hypothetical protein